MISYVANSYVFGKLILKLLTVTLDILIQA